MSASKATVLLVEGRYHLGNNPGVFQNATYIGWTLNLPVTVTWYDESSTEVAFIIRTQDLESWGGAGGHQVLFNGVEIGRLRDADTSSSVETFRIPLATSRFTELLKGDKLARLSIVVEIGATPTLADDFLLTRIETEETLALRIGASER